jgi:hypothetical protein
MLHVILTLSGTYNLEVHHGGVALYYKHKTSLKLVDVYWYDGKVGADAPTYEPMNSTSTQKISTNSSAQEIALYVIAHAEASKFAGQKATALAGMLRDFIYDKLKLSDSTKIKKLCLIGCGVAKAIYKGPEYLVQLAQAWPAPGRIIAWEEFITLFSIPQLISLCNKRTDFNKLMTDYQSECEALLKGSKSEGAIGLLEQLRDEEAKGSHLLRPNIKGKAFGPKVNEEIIKIFGSIDYADIFKLLGKRVIKLNERDSTKYFCKYPPDLALHSLPKRVTKVDRTGNDLLLSTANASQLAVRPLLESYLNRELAGSIIDYLGGLYSWRYDDDKAKVMLERSCY